MHFFHSVKFDDTVKYSGFRQIQLCYCARLPPGGSTKNLQNNILYMEKRQKPVLKACFL